jgi:hypothetical protein
MQSDQTVQQCTEITNTYQQAIQQILQMQIPTYKHLQNSNF